MEIIFATKIKTLFNIMENENNKSYGKYIVYVIACILWLILTKNWDDIIMPAGWTGVILFVLIVSAAELPFWVSRYYTSWFVCDGAAGSFNHNYSPLTIKDVYVTKDKQQKEIIWSVYGLGACSFLAEMRGKLDTVIVPSTQVDTTSKHHKSNTKVSPIDLSSLSIFPNLYNELIKRSDEFNLDKIKFGWVTTDFSYKNTTMDDIDLKVQLERQASLISLQTDIINRKFDQFEEIKNLTDRLKDKPTFWDRARSVVGGGNKDEN
jgi:hypothetical protein